MKFVLAILAALGVVSASEPTGDMSDRRTAELNFESWRREFDIEFETPLEYVNRLDVFISNDNMINEHNAGGYTWTLAHNQFSHLTFNEFRSMMLGFSDPAPKPDSNSTFVAPKDFIAPKSFDWRTKGAVTAVKNQGQCGSCWAFSTTGALEGAHFLKTGELVAFSEQELVDCDHNQDQGCRGGLMDNAFDWIKSNGGLCKEADYAYTAADGMCMKNKCTSVASTADIGHVDIAKTENDLMAAVTETPIAIAIEADQQGFQFYHSGVFTGACGTALDHGVLLVGFGKQLGKDYWIVKNSWGSTWGDAGYIKLQRGNSQVGGQCGILMSASFPQL